MSLSWIEDDLIAYTRDVWGKYLGRPVSEEEAIDMLVNIKQLTRLLLERGGMA